MPSALQIHRTLTTAILCLAVTSISVSCAEETAEPPSNPKVAETPPEPEPEPKPEPEPEPPAFDKAGRSIDDPTSIWVISNKHRPLNPLAYEPDDLVFPEGVSNMNGQPLRAEAAQAFTEMVHAAESDGVWFQMGSAYRDYARQEMLYSGYIDRDGQAAADTYSARPGHSEHQTGLVVDVDGGECYLQACFGDTEAGMWLAEHAAEYGWIMRYPLDYDHITGFTYEPWHYRYVGSELALEMRAQNVHILEEFFELEPAPDYL